MRKRLFTLLELMISLIFLAFVLSTLFYWYRSLQVGKKEREKRAHLAKELRYFDVQLNRILPRANLMPHFFTSSDESLVFTFDYGPQQEALLSNTVLGKLFLDRGTGSLCLGIWPKPDNKDRSVEEVRVLLEGVKNVKFKFYYPPDPYKLAIEPEEVGNPLPKMGWQQEWRDDFHTLPVMVRVHVELEKQEKIFTYDLPLASRSRIVCTH